MSSITSHSGCLGTVSTQGQCFTSTGISIIEVNTLMLMTWLLCPHRIRHSRHDINNQWINTNQTSILNSLRPRQNGRRFTDDIFKCIFLNENVSIAIEISLKFVPKGPINNIPALVQIMAWRRPGDKPLSEPMMVSLPTHICVTRPQ